MCDCGIIHRPECDADEMRFIQQQAPAIIPRRDALKKIGLGFLGVQAAAFMPNHAVAAMALPRSLFLQNMNSKETLNITYWQGGRYSPVALARISWLMRDTHFDKAMVVDRRMVDLLYVTYRLSRSRAPIHILSGFRTKAYNETVSAATNSYHTRGQAVDFRLDDIPASHLVRIGKTIKIGGVGDMAKRNFVHLDVGPYRTW